MGDPPLLCLTYVLLCVLGEFLLKELSIWVVVDLGTEQGRQVARNAISYTVSLPPPPSQTSLKTVCMVSVHVADL